MLASPTSSPPRAGICVWRHQRHSSRAALCCCVAVRPFCFPRVLCVSAATGRALRSGGWPAVHAWGAPLRSSHLCMSCAFTPRLQGGQTSEWRLCLRRECSEHVLIRFPSRVPPAESRLSSLPNVSFKAAACDLRRPGQRGTKELVLESAF